MKKHPDITGVFLKDEVLDLEMRARSVLFSNWIGQYTLPAKGLYPHQWSWDAAFIAIGYCHYDPDKARSELDSILSAQWDNGLVPHIVFNPEASGYFPGLEFWKTGEHSPLGKFTSGIVQPPVHAIAALKYYKHTQDEKSLRRWFLPLKKWHRYLLENRDPEHSGFATIYHPWESGFDNSPRWDDSMARLEPKDLPDYQRADLEHVSSAEERPTQEDYDKFIYLVEILKKFDYDDKRVYKEIPFKIKDVVFNTILVMANKALLELAQILGEDKSEISEWLGREEDSFIKQFCPDTEESLFYDYDLITGQFIRKRTVASLIPIYADLIDKAMIKKTVEWLNHSHFCATGGVCKFPLVPSTSLDSPSFAHVTYWRGPIWINTNWMIYQGLRFYNFNDIAKRIREAILALVKEHGFYEYYDPHDGAGFGGENFSWSASLTIDLIRKCDID